MITLNEGKPFVRKQINDVLGRGLQGGPSYRAPAAAPRSPELVAALKKKARARRCRQKKQRLQTWTGKRGNGWEELRKLIEREKNVALLVAVLGAPSNDNVMVFVSKRPGDRKGKQYHNPGKAAVRRDRALRKKARKAK